MSRDLDRILALGPFTLCWRPSGGSDPLQVERERDCPLARYSIGLARLAGGLTPTDSNWNWAADWEQNLEQGAVPSDALLFLARIPEALLLFLAGLLMARIGWRLGGGVGAVSAAALFGLNSEVLLHGRRAMSEAALLFGMILTVAVVIEQRRNSGWMFRMVVRPLLAGAALAIAVSAKYSGLLLAPVALAGMFFAAGETPPRRLVLHGMARSGGMILAFLAVFLVLNPVYWCDPLGTLAAVAAERQRLLSEQVAALTASAPQLILDSIPLRLLAVPYALFIDPPAFWDISNYAGATAAAERAYLAQPLHALTAGGIGSLLFCVLTLSGLGLVAVRVFRRGSNPSWMILAVWFLSVLAGIVIEVPILWQRYYLPLVPLAAVFSAAAITAIVEKMVRLSHDRHPRESGDPGSKPR
jgi:4-amino-4-deoxy-L-arabinose transferase-like glycosyltransferase